MARMGRPDTKEYGDSIMVLVFCIMLNYNIVVVTPHFHIPFDVMGEDAGRTVYLKLVSEHYSATISSKFVEHSTSAV